MAKRHGGAGGVIVNVSSAAAKHGGPFTYVDYAASKAAVDTFTVGWQKSRRPGIRVNTLRPGATLTELSVEWAKDNPDWLDWVMRQVPLGRPAEVAEIANAGLFLLSDKSSYVTAPSSTSAAAGLVVGGIAGAGCARSSLAVQSRVTLPVLSRAWRRGKPITIRSMPQFQYKSQQFQHDAVNAVCRCVS